MASASDSKPAPLDLDVLIQRLPPRLRYAAAQVPVRPVFVSPALCTGALCSLTRAHSQCTKAGADCIFYDHGRNEFLPRSYIAELVDHVRRLSPHADSSPAASSATPANDTPSTSTIKIDPDSGFADSRQYEHYFAFAGDDYRYLGSESCLLRSPRLQPRKVRSPLVLDDDDEDWHLTWKKSSAKEWELLDLYLEIIQPVYPILDLSLPDFTLNMIYSISCYILPNTGKKRDAQHMWNPSGRLSYHQANSLKYRALATEYYNKAMEKLEAATMDPNMATLRAVLLLAIHSSFDPKSGNAGQQIALAARLAFDLEAKSELQTGELQELQPTEIEVLRNMHMTIFSLENQIASTLDRPALFPEPKEEKLYFPFDKPAEFMYDLFRLQNRFRKGRGNPATEQACKDALPPLDDRAKLLPIVRIALHMTHLLLNPVWGSAWHVLEAVVSLGGIHVFVTPHWVYRAGTVLIQNIPSIFGGNLIQLYSNALLVLELSSWKWPSSATLSASLVDLMQQMKIKYRPDWSDKLQSGDVRI
ncbi:hypothetical protein DE146DRAFT_629471 [Phaeosphaeria sp. MPI-PUGE-AT-0046c]|nr:hypothetical protein DE146DRAFT_629471 [Phaeosphaeria sp. MPI-PUGE-AT-0046c]